MASDPPPPLRALLTSGQNENINNHHVDGMGLDSSHVYVNTNFFQSLKSELMKQMELEVLCDAVVKAGPKWWVAHACILAASSPYLHEVVTQNLRSDLTISGKQVRIVELPEDTSNGIPVLLHYFYSGVLNLMMTNVREVLALSQQLSVGRVSSFCSTFLLSNITDKTWFDILNISKELNICEVTDAIDTYLISNFASVSNSVDFLRLEYEEVKCLLMNCRDAPFPEHLKFEAILKWDMYDHENRFSPCLDLLHLLDACHLDKNMVSFILRKQSFASIANQPDIRTYLCHVPGFQMESIMHEMVVSCIETHGYVPNDNNQYTSHNRNVCKSDIARNNQSECLEHELVPTDSGSHVLTSSKSPKNVAECAHLDKYVPLDVAANATMEKTSLPFMSVFSENPPADESSVIYSEECTGQHSENGRIVEHRGIVGEDLAMWSLNGRSSKKPPGTKSSNKNIRPKSRRSLRKRHLPKRLQDSGNDYSGSSHNSPSQIVQFGSQKDNKATSFKGSQRKGKQKQQQKSICVPDNDHRNVTSLTSVGSKISSKSEVVKSIDNWENKILPQDTEQNGMTEEKMHDLYSPTCSDSVEDKEIKADSGTTGKMEEKQGEQEVEFPVFAPARRKRHKKAILETEMYHCDRCPRRFVTMSSLRHHQKGHGSDIPLLCEICGFKTRHFGSMKVHKRQHSGEKFKCNFEGCNWVTVVKSRLEDHYSSHQGIRKHTCSHCGKAFIQRKHLHRHEKMHTDTHRYACSECNYKTPRSDKYKLHMRRHHPVIAVVSGLMTEEEKNSIKAAKKKNLDKRKKYFVMDQHVEITNTEKVNITHAFPGISIRVLPTNSPMPTNKALMGAHDDLTSGIRSYHDSIQDAKCASFQHLQQSPSSFMKATSSTVEMPTTSVEQRLPFSERISGKSIAHKPHSPALSGHDYALTEVQKLSTITSIGLLEPIAKNMLVPVSLEAKGNPESLPLSAMSKISPPHVGLLYGQQEQGHPAAEIHDSNTNITSDNPVNASNTLPSLLTGTNTISEEMIQYLAGMSQEVHTGQP